MLSRQRLYVRGGLGVRGCLGVRRRPSPRVRSRPRAREAPCFEIRDNWCVGVDGGGVQIRGGGCRAGGGFFRRPEPGPVLQRRLQRRVLVVQVQVQSGAQAPPPPQLNSNQRYSSFQNISYELPLPASPPAR